MAVAAGVLATVAVAAGEAVAAMEAAVAVGEEEAVAEGGRDSLGSSPVYVGKIVLSDYYKSVGNVGMHLVPSHPCFPVIFLL